MSAKQMRIGLIGAGAVAQTYGQALSEAATVRLVGVADVRQPAAVALAERMGCPAFGSYEELLEETDCEAVVLCTPPVTHHVICCQLVERGIHVLCEKPLAIGPEEARAMVATAERSAATLTMASKFRLPASRAMSARAAKSPKPAV